MFQKEPSADYPIPKIFTIKPQMIRLTEMQPPVFVFGYSIIFIRFIPTLDEWHCTNKNPITCQDTRNLRGGFEIIYMFQNMVCYHHIITSTL